ncbi:MAG TPA: hypothetical protein PK760_12750, partial [Flavobacteriales bacterium]|nr:hypothetical protein [Flavobacteriales bacterium]
MRSLFIPFAVAVAAQANAQCGPCTASDTCVVDPPFPSVCPATTLVGTVGVPYALDVTLWIPASFAEPNAGLTVVLQQVTANTIENVPLGLTYEASSPNFTFY